MNGANVHPIRTSQQLLSKEHVPSAMILEETRGCTQLHSDNWSLIRYDMLQHAVRWWL